SPELPSFLHDALPILTDDHERTREEQRAEHDEHADDRDVEAEVVGEAGAHSENHSLLGVAVQTITLQILHGRILVSVITSSVPVRATGGGCSVPHVFFFHSGCWTSRIVSSVFRRLSMDWLAFQSSSSSICSS